MKLCLDGSWEAGTNRSYDRVVQVPGLASDPGRINQATLWYKKEINLPPGKWSHATLILNGARFCPSIYIEGEKVSESSGGMTVTTHLLGSKDVVPGNRIILEIALKSLKDVDPQDASKIPSASLWRSNISSCLWDNVILRLHRSSRITRLIPFPDLKKNRISVYWEIENLLPANESLDINIQVINQDGTALAYTEVEDIDGKGKAYVYLDKTYKLWSPENPSCYRLKAVLRNKDEELDSCEMTLGLKEFRTEGRNFVLNDKPVSWRGGTVVWHRWLRDSEARELAFNAEWFKKNIILRLKDHGANAIRFHLGTPPEAFLNFCDKHGMMVQIEWSFFHGIKASKKSIIQQWRNWLNLCMKHPSICIIQGWNETEGEEIKKGFSALDALAPEYPPLVIAHRDTLHLHRYWWSLSENLGLYYDSACQFDQPTIVDEFGGNYLDGEGNPGGYPQLRESFLRFLGRDHTKNLRLQLHCESTTQIAEYWRRMGVAGFSPFCILGSPEDGNHHFLGKLEEANPKEVWAGLTAAYSPRSCSLEVWDRNYVPGERVTLPLCFFNDTNNAASLIATVNIVLEKNHSSILTEKKVRGEVSAYSTEKREIRVQLPVKEGEWRFQAILNNPSKTVFHPVISSWRFRTMKIKVPAILQGIEIAVPEWEKELVDFLEENNLGVGEVEHPEAKILVTSAATWTKLSRNSHVKYLLKKAIGRGCSVVMLDIGPMDLGQEYLTMNDDLSCLPGSKSVKNPETLEIDLFYGIKILFHKLAEAESCIHPSESDNSLWENLDQQATWLWNGLRGGLIVPARDMEVTGLGPSAFVSLWRSRGADVALIKGNSYFACELAGFYAFSKEKNAENELRAKVKLLVEDAPALQLAIDSDAPIKVFDLVNLYKQSKKGQIKNLIPLASCEKNLTRTPVTQINFGKGKGKLILSQLITNGRLAKGYGRKGLYGIRPDPAAAQFVLNMLKKCAAE